MLEDPTIMHSRPLTAEPTCHARWASLLHGPPKRMQNDGLLGGF